MNVATHPLRTEDELAQHYRELLDSLTVADLQEELAAWQLSPDTGGYPQTRRLRALAQVADANAESEANDWPVPSFHVQRRAVILLEVLRQLNPRKYYLGPGPDGEISVHTYGEPRTTFSVIIRPERSIHAVTTANGKTESQIIEVRTSTEYLRQQLQKMGPDIID